MSYYSISININSNNQGILTAVKNVIPLGDDPIVVEGGCNFHSGDNFFTADIQFKEKVDRDDVLQTIKGLNGVIHACLSGSEVIGYIQNHAEGLPCEAETILRKD